MKRHVEVWLPCKLSNGQYCLVALFSSTTAHIDRCRRVLHADGAKTGAPSVGKPSAKRALVEIGATRDQAERSDVITMKWWDIKADADV